MSRFTLQRKLWRQGPSGISSCMSLVYLHIPLLATPPSPSALALSPLFIAVAVGNCFTADNSVKNKT